MSKATRSRLLVLLVGRFAIAAALAVATLSYAESDDTVVATVNDHEIRLADVYVFIESFPIGDQIAMRQRLDLVIQSLVHEEVLFQSILNAEDDWESDLRAEIKSQTADRVIEKHVRQQASVSDEEISDYYNANREVLNGRHIRVRHIRLGERPECEEMMERIDSEEAFAEVARAHSLDELSADKGGDLGYLRYAPDDPNLLGFEHEFFDMDLQEMRVFESTKGCHLVRVTEIDDPEDPPFEQIREFLKPRLEEQKARERMAELMERASRNVTVTIIEPAEE